MKSRRLFLLSSVSAAIPFLFRNSSLPNANILPKDQILLRVGLQKNMYHRMGLREKLNTLSEQVFEGTNGGIFLSITKNAAQQCDVFLSSPAFNSENALFNALADANTFGESLEQKLEFFCSQDGRRVMESLLSDNNSLPLFFGFGPSQQGQFSTRAIESLESYKGMRVVSMDSRSEWYQPLKVNLVSAQSPQEMIALLEQGQIDLTDALSHFANRMLVHKSTQQFLYYHNNFLRSAPLFVLNINRSKWNELKPAQQELLREETTRLGRDLTFESQSYNDLYLQGLKAQGMTVRNLPADVEQYLTLQRQALQKALVKHHGLDLRLRHIAANNFVGVT